MVSAFILSHVISYAQSSVNDFFPLNIGNAWTYEYNTSYWVQLGGSISYDSGITVYKVISKTSTQDSIAWGMRENRNILHSDYYYGTGFPRDTSYSIIDSAGFQITEFNSDNHRILSSSKDWKSVYYLNPVFNDSISFFRYLTPTSADTASIVYRTYKFNKVYEILSIAFQQDVGVKRISYSAPGRAGFVPISNHKLKSATITKVAKSLVSALSADFVLSQNYPNPFNPTTEIPLTVQKETNLTVKIYDVLGRLVETLYDGRIYAGEYSIRWVADHQSGGVYFCVARTTNNSRSIKIALTK